MVWRLPALTSIQKHVVILTLFIIIGLTGKRCDTTGSEKYFTNGWAIQVNEPGGFERVKRLAEKHGFEKIEKIGTLEGFYHLEHPKHPTRSRRSAEDRTEVLQNEDEIIWAEQQHERIRQKRGAHHERGVARGIVPRFADPLWEEQWYLDDKRNLLDLDINVIPIWNKGITGKGVVVTILDDGIEHNHTDLEKNYDPAASWDVNDNDPDPFPRYDPTNENKHGTRCAGEVAAQANNSKCGVGVAFNARIGGVRMLDGRVTDRVEAESLSLNPQYIDIYSASWGPSDDGTTVEGPGTLAAAAFINGIAKGRNGLGSIYIWASGNGGRHDDSCNCDGYTASIYTLSISSSSDHGESPWYSEACSSTLATTLSSGAHGEKRIVTTDLHNQCTERHTGTSASAPLAAAIIALALEKNPKLTWRDVQHIVVHTANWLPLKHDPEWRMNGVGLHVNEKFGFGLLDAERIVNKANKNLWRPVPAKKECKGRTYSDARPLRWDRPLTIEIESDGCTGTRDEIRYLEHLQMLMTLEYTRRGDLTIHLTTPMGTRTCLLPTRSEDASDEGFKKWIFMSTHAWGEDPRGKWTLEIKDAGDSRANTGTLREWQLILHGTKEKPSHQNITHPEVPLHRKAVVDDVRATQGNQQSSVTITKVTYTFGSNILHPLSQVKTISDLPTINPLNAFLSTTTPSMQAAVVATEVCDMSGRLIAQVPGYTQSSIIPNQNYERTAVLGQQTYNVNDYNGGTSLYPYGDPRNTMPYNVNNRNYPNYPQLYNRPNVNYYANQHPAPPPPQINAPVSRSSSSYEYNDMRWNVPSRFNLYNWNLYGRIAKKRQIESLRMSKKNKIYLDRKSKRDLLLKKLRAFEKLKRRYRT